MAEFLKSGKRVIPKPAGADYDLIPGQVYDLTWDNWNGNPVFTENGNLNLPKKVYRTKKDDILRARVLNYFNKSHTLTTGVMLSGYKGTGKTVLAKLIAKESELPIVVVDPEYPAARLIDFFKQFTTPVCVLLDEIEKNFKTDKMLEFLDGIQETCKKLVLMTCNDEHRISEYMKDRCSRVRYWRRYTQNEQRDIVVQVVKDFDFKNEKEITEYIISKFKSLSMDLICAFLNEYDLLKDIPDITFDEVVEFMNISTDETKPSVPGEKDTEEDNEISF